MLLCTYEHSHVQLVQKEWAFVNHGAFGSVVKEVLEAQKVNIYYIYI